MGSGDAYGFRVAGYLSEKSGSFDNFKSVVAKICQNLIRIRHRRRVNHKCVGGIAELWGNLVGIIIERNHGSFVNQA